MAADPKPTSPLEAAPVPQSEEKEEIPDHLLKPLPSSFDDSRQLLESPWIRVRNRLLQEPLIPVFTLMTCYALFRAQRSIRIKDKASTNMWFRRRIYFQGLALVSLVGGSYYYEDKRKAEKEREIEVRKNVEKEKKERWLRELEARDVEEREFMEREKKRAERERGN